MKKFNDKKFILRIDLNYLILNYPNPLYLINSENMLEAFDDVGCLVIKLPFTLLRFKPEDIIPFADSTMNGVKMLTKTEFINTFPIFNNDLKLTSVYIPQAAKYLVLADSFSNASIINLGVFTVKNPDFKLDIVFINYTISNSNFRYCALTPKDLKEEYNSKFTGNLTPFNLASISWCYQIENKNKTIIFLIYMPHLYPEDHQNFTTDRTEKLSFIKSILDKYKPEDEPKPKNILCSTQTTHSENDVTNGFIKIEPNTFSIIHDLFSSPLNHSQCYFSNNLYQLLMKWIILAFQVCLNLSDGNNVVIEDIEGIPSSIIIGSLSKIMIDKNYCTFEGFIGLIRDDWINRAFFYNIGNPKSLNERLHIFYAWLTCVQFLLSKYPENFEFTFWLIHYITNNLWTKRFYPFCYDCKDGDIFEKLAKFKYNFTNFGYYSKKIHHVYHSIIKEINPMKLNMTYTVQKLNKIFNNHIEKFFKLFDLELDNLNSMNSDIQTLVHLWKGKIAEFISNSFFDPDVHVYMKQIEAATKPLENLPNPETSNNQITRPL